MQMQLAPLTEAVTTGLYRGAAAGSLRMGFVDARDIAAVPAEALTSSRFDGQMLVPTGPSAPSFDEIATALARVSGRDVVYVQRSEAELRHELETKHWPQWHIDDYLKIHGEASSDLVTTDVFDATGENPRSIVDFMVEHLPHG